MNYHEQMYRDNLYCHKHMKTHCQTCIDELTALGIQADKDLIAQQQGQIEALKADLDRLHRERDAFQGQCRVMAEENARYLNMLVDAGLLEQ